jgi:integrase
VIDIKRRHVTVEVDRHGNERHYFRVGHGRRVRLAEEPGSEAFDQRYHELLRQHQAGELRQEPRGTREHGVAKDGTWRSLAQDYMGSPKFRALDPGTQRARQRMFEHTFKEPISPGAKELFADFPLIHFNRKVVKILHNLKADTPDAANARLQAIRAVFEWALDNEDRRVTANPARDVKRLPPKRPGGWPTWSEDEIEKFHARHPRGTKARVAFDLMLYTGARRSDIIRLGRQHIRGGVLSFQAFKGRNKKPMQVDLPILPELLATLDALPVGDLVFLVSQLGRPFTANGFWRWFKSRCREAGVNRSPHGLRKAAAVRLAHAGASPHMLQAWFAWSDPDMASIYTEAVDRKRLAGSAARLLEGPEGEQKSLTRGVRAPTVREKGGKK